MRRFAGVRGLYGSYCMLSMMISAAILAPIPGGNADLL